MSSVEFFFNTLINFPLKVELINGSIKSSFWSFGATTYIALQALRMHKFFLRVR